MKRLLFVIALLTGSAAFAIDSKRPPEAMITNQNESAGPLIDRPEIPASIIPAAGGVIQFEPNQQGERDRTMTAVLGEPYSGAMKDADCLGIEGVPCFLDYGYGVFEFYSDRIPIYDLQLTLNGGKTVTNMAEILLDITFKDDLSGFTTAYVKLETGEQRALTFFDRNTLAINLDPQNTGVLNKVYPLDFTFWDRAGNKTENFHKSIILDREAPEIHSVIINNGDQFVSRSTVNVTVVCSDTLAFPNGVAGIKLSNSLTGFNSTTQIYPTIQSTTTIFNWYLGDEVEGNKTVYALCMDSAGNESSISSDTIQRGSFNPNGTFDFKYDNLKVIHGPDGPEASDPNLNIVIDWVPELAGNLQRIEISILESETPVSNEAIPQQNPPLDRSITLVSGEEIDGDKTVRVVFIDTLGNRSENIEKTIRLNRNLPLSPIVLSLDVQTSSIAINTRVVQFKQGISSISVTRSDFKNPDVTEYIGLAYATAPIVHVATGLSPNTGYKFQLRAHDLFRASHPTETTPSVIYTRAALPTATGELEARETSVIRASWGDSGNPPDTLYQLDYSKDSSFSSFVAVRSTVTRFTQIDIEGLDIATLYHFRVRARNNQEPSLETEPVLLGSTSTLNFIQPLPPVEFRPVFKSSTTVVWGWIRHNSTEQEFVIEHTTGGFIGRIPVLAATTWYTFTEYDLIPDTRHDRQVYSVNGYPFWQKISTASIVFTPPAPPLVLADSLKSRASTIIAKWGTNGNPMHSKYEARISANDDFTLDVESSGLISETEFEFRGLRPSTTYYIDVRAIGQTDNFGNPNNSAVVFLGTEQTETLDHGKQIDLDSVPFWRLAIPPNTFDRNFTSQMQSNVLQFESATLDVIQQATEKARRESNGYRFPIPGGLIEVILAGTDTARTPVTPLPGKQATLIHSFADITTVGALSADSIHVSMSGPARAPAPNINEPSDDQKDIRIETLRIWKLDTKTQSWIKLPSNELEASQSEINSGYPTFGVFAVMGTASLEVNDAISYPIPWRPNGPNAGTGAGQTGTHAMGIQFANLPQEGRISIFDLQGAAVKEINLTGGLTQSWDGKNSGGEDVASGTYFWVIEAGDNRKKGKLVVIR